MAFEGPQGGDIRATLALSQAEAQTGSSRTLTLPEGRRITVPIRAGIRDGEEIRLKGQGEPAWPGGPIGDLILTVSIPVTHYGGQPFYDNPGSPTEFVPSPSVPPTLPATNYPMPPAASNPNYAPVGPYGSPSPNYPPPGGGFANYPEQGQRQEPLVLPQNQAPYAGPPPYMGYSQAGQQIPQQVTPPPTKRGGPSSTVAILLIIIALVLIVGGGLIYYAGVYQPQKMHEQATATANAQVTGTAQANARATANALATSTAQANATATAQASATAAASATATALQTILTQATSGNPALNDPLSAPSGYNWDQFSATNSTGSCTYTGGAYHSNMPQKSFFQPCFAEAPTFGDFAFQVQMTITQGDEGGIIFRADPVNSKFYLFRISQNGTYDLFLYVDNQGSHAKNLLSSSTTLFKTGQNQTNTITVVARGGNMYFYINSQYLDSASDNTFASGKIGVFAESNTNPTDVAFSNAEAWQL